MAFIEVLNNQEFDFLNSAINQRLADADPRYVFSVWARKIYGNGSGGFYMPIPSGDRLTLEIEELIEGYQQYDYPPTIAPPNSFPAMSITDNLEYSTADFTNLGRVATGLILTIGDTYYFKNTLNQEYFLLNFRDGQGIIVKVADNTFIYFNSGFLKHGKPIYLENDRELVYICSSSPDLFKVNIDTGTITFTTVKGVTITSTNSGFQDRCVGTDGMIYIGTSLDARVFKYNPATNAITSFPQLFNLPGYITYAYFVGADANWIYTFLRQSGNYFFAILNQTTGVITYISSISDEYRAGDLMLYKDTATGTKFWRLRLRTSLKGLPDVTYHYRDGVLRPDLIANESLFDTEQFTYFSYNNYYTQFPTRYGYNVLLDGTTGLNGDAYFDYKLVTSPTYTRITFTGVDKSDFELSTMEIDANGNLLIGYSTYGPVAIWDTNTDTLDQVNPFSTTSLYAIKAANDRIYFGGYDNITSKFDITQPWQLTVNPVKVPINLQNALYHYFYAVSGDWLYICQEIARNATGTAISMYNTSTGEIINPSASTIALLKPYGISYMFTMDFGNKLVLLSKPLETSYPRVFVWDISIEKNINNVTPQQHELNLANLAGGYGVPYNATIFYAFIANVIYRFDISTMTVTYKSLPNVVQYAQFYKHPICQTPDGRVYWIGRPATESYLYQLDLLNFAGIRKSSNLGPLITNRSLIAKNDKIYLYHGYNNSSVTAVDGVYSQYWLEKMDF